MTFRFPFDIAGRYRVRLTYRSRVLFEISFEIEEVRS